MPSRGARWSMRPTTTTMLLENGRSVAMHIFASLLILLILSANKTNDGESTVLCDAAAVGSLVLPPTQMSAVYLSRTSSGRSVSVSTAGTINERNANNIDDQSNGVEATAAALHSTSTSSLIVNLTRQHGGDVFDAMGKTHIHFNIYQFQMDSHHPLEDVRPSPIHSGQQKLKIEHRLAGNGRGSHKPFSQQQWKKEIN